MRSLALRVGLLTGASTLGLFVTITCGGSTDLTFVGGAGEGGQGGSAGEGGLGPEGGGGSSTGGAGTGGAGTGGSSGAGTGGSGTGGRGAGGGGGGEPGDVCGDGEIDGDESCDQSDLGGQDCTSRGHVSGQLACDANCDFDESECFSFEHVFTSCGVSGQQGPTIDDCRAAYDTDWDEDETQFAIGSQGYQLWVVPVDGTYRIEAFGAQGGSFEGDFQGGLGARIQGDFSLLAGSAVALVVGQMGNGSGGGGGTFVSDIAGNPFVVAGGGSGASSGVANGSPGLITLDGAGAGGAVDDYGCGAAGGGGFYGDGASATTYANATGGGSYYNAGVALGGNGANCSEDFTVNWGGFGGGGGGGYLVNSAGGGGYNGGNGKWSGSGTGGTSYNSGTNQQATEGVQIGHGQVKIARLVP